MAPLFDRRTPTRLGRTSGTPGTAGTAHRAPRMPSLLMAVLLPWLGLAAQPGLLAGAAVVGLMHTPAAMAAEAVSVSLDQARAELAGGKTVVIDIREPAEHAAGVAAGMRLLPMSQIGRRLQEIPDAPDQPVLLICNTQNRSSKVVQALRERGWKNVRYVEGGMSEWKRRNWPMVAPAGAQPAPR